MTTTTKPSPETMLGYTFRDKVTGLVGLATTYCVHLTGCDSVILQPAANAEGAVPEGRWCDVTRLDLVSTVERVTPQAPALPGEMKPGADRYAQRATGGRH